MKYACLLLSSIPDKKGTHTVAFSNFLENNSEFSTFSYTDLSCVNRAVYPMNFAHLNPIVLFVNCKRTG